MSPVRSVSVFFCVVVVVGFVSAVSGKTIRWTAAAGNPLWNSPNNWDSLSVPTAADDVIIDVANIPGNVQIGLHAECFSLTIGGSSNTNQTLTIYTSLDIGKGGGEIMTNGNLMLYSSPSNPLTTAGLFKGNSKFTFVSGALGGVGVFAFVNIPFNGDALKVINATTQVMGSLIIDPGTGSAVIQISPSAVLNVSGTLKSSRTVEFISFPGALLLVPGIMMYDGGPEDVLSIQGDAVISTFNVSGIVTIEDNVTVGTTFISPGGTIQVMGSFESTRKFGLVNGPGVIVIQGGTNVFSTIDKVDVRISGGDFVVTGTSFLANLESTGGQIQGGADISVATSTFSNTIIFSTPMVVSVLYVNGNVQLVSSSLTVMLSLVISSQSQITLNDGASLFLNPSALVTHSFPLEIFPGGSTKPSYFVNNGKWSSSSDLKLFVNTSGNGIFGFGQGSTLEISGVTFQTSTITLTDSSISIIGSVFTVGYIYGNGNIQTQGQTFTVLNSLQASTFSHSNGITEVGTASLTTLNMAVGSFIVDGSSFSINTLNFIGGTISGASTTTLNVATLNVSGELSKTFASAVVKINKTLNFYCNLIQCPLFTTNAKVLTSCSK